MSPKLDGPKPDELLLKEFDQAWQHYRHVESGRSQYLGFFFTAVFGVLAVAMNLMKGQPIDSPWLLPGVAALGAVLSVVAAVVFLAIAKAGFVLSHYERAYNTVRTITYRALDDESILELRRLNIRKRGWPSSEQSQRLSLLERIKSLLFSTHNMALCLVGLASIAILGLEVCGAWEVQQRNLLTGKQQMVMWALALLSLLASTVVVFAAVAFYGPHVAKGMRSKWESLKNTHRSTGLDGMVG